ncbi:MAG: hypothetical protein ACREBG_23630 [Pyrinomonadaceae bacterium]
MRILVSTILVCLLVISCGRKEHQRLAIAYVIDLTASVDNDAILQAFGGLDPLLNGKRLKRGDSLTAIPITGDTLTETQGKILRIHLNEKREVYDSDLTNLAKDVQKRLEAIQSEATAHPYTHSDILGAADLAAEELESEKGDARKVLIILSDFIQDDSKFNFNTSADLANERVATDLAKKLSVQHAAEFAGITVYLGMLRSKDLKRMPNARRAAVQTFWREFFQRRGAKSVASAIDGPGKLPAMLDKAETSTTN